MYDANELRNTSQLSCTLVDPYVAFETKSFKIKTTVCLIQYLLFSYFAWNLHISRTDVVPSTLHASALGWMKIFPINYNILLSQNRVIITWLYLSQIVYSHNIFFYHGRIKLKLSIHKQKHLLSLTTLMLQLSRQRKRPSMPDTSRYR